MRLYWNCRSFSPALQNVPQRLQLLRSEQYQVERLNHGANELERELVASGRQDRGRLNVHDLGVQEDAELADYEGTTDLEEATVGAEELQEGVQDP